MYDRRVVLVPSSLACAEAHPSPQPPPVAPLVSAPPRLQSHNLWLEVGAQASAVRGKNVSDGSYLVFVPPDRLRGSVTITRRDFLGLERFFASVSGTYVARQTRFDMTADLAPPPDAYFLADAEIGVDTRVDGQILKVALQGTNIFGARYREYTSLLRYFVDQPGRQLMVRITMSYGSSNQKP